VRAWDWGLRRLSTFTESGTFLEGKGLPSLPKTDPRFTSMPFPLRVLPDGRVLAAGPPFKMDPRTGNYRDSTSMWLIDTSGNMIRVGSWYSSASYVLHTPDGNMVIGNTPFGPQGQAVPVVTGWIASGGEDFEIRHHSLDGTLRQIVRVQRPPRMVTDVARQWFMDSLLGQYELESRDAERNAVEWAEWSATMPAYDRLVVDSLGSTWARIYPYDAPIATWDVFDTEGRLVATAATPSTLEVEQIGPDWVLGQGKGEMDEPLVYLFRLTR
jgi:hypothetical protein